MKFNIIFHVSPLYLAIEKKSVETVKLLLSKPNININFISVLLLIRVYTV